jgi:hypothetical protein
MGRRARSAGASPMAALDGGSAASFTTRKTDLRRTTNAPLPAATTMTSAFCRPGIWRPTLVRSPRAARARGPKPAPQRHRHGTRRRQRVARCSLRDGHVHAQLRWFLRVPGLRRAGRHPGRRPTRIDRLKADVLRRTVALRRRAGDERWPSACLQSRHPAVRFGRRTSRVFRLFVESGGGGSRRLTPGHGRRDAEGEEATNAIVGADGIGRHEAEFA